ncbi:ATP-binding protein [Natronoarchaeum sp. GCM10025703]|uniref:ATP-binding protein n=1 Tax=Natronoarchaeum sp. GCM10025703 TaxID=3252685 RepID=UPI00361AD206
MEAEAGDGEVEAGDVEAGDAEVETGDVEAESSEPEAETAEAEVDADDETSKVSPDDMGSLDDEELFAEGEADEPVAEEAGLDDVEVRDVDDTGESPDLDLEDPFAAPSADTESEPAAPLDAEDDAESAVDAGTDDTEVSEAGSFGDLDFGDPADPEAEPEELDDGGFGSADELDLSMDLEEAEDEPADAEDEPGDAEADSADASATVPETTAEPEQSSETAADADGSATAEASVSTEPSDEAVEASVESVDLDSDADAEEGPPTEITEAVKADDATADYSQPSAAAGTAVDTETVQSVRVDVDQVDQLMNLVEGLVSTRARLRRAVDAEESRRVIDSEVDELDALTSELQDTVMDVRLVPLQKVVNKLPRLVRDISRDQDKRVTLDMEGEDVEVDRSILDEIGDPLMHIVRNAIDHGIEPPEEREDAGKEPSGTIELSAWRERDQVVIEIEDDGRGIDADELGDSAVEQGIIGRDDLLAMEESDIYELVFHPGFSTSEEVTDVSGRGVGMDVVASTIESLDGDVGIESDPGEGTTVRIEVPISLAIADVLFVESGGEEYGIPTRVVSEIGPSGSVSVEDGREVVTRGETAYPLIRLDEALDTPERGQNGDGMLVQVRDDVRPVAVHCDRVRGQQEVVVKPFEGFIGNIPGLSGATVLGEGDVVNILDVETL